MLNPFKPTSRSQNVMRIGSQIPQKPSAQPPEILIFFHIPKTGGTSMDVILSRCFPDAQHFNGAMFDTRSALSIKPREKIEARYHALSNTEREAIRCLMGTIYPMGIHTMLDRPAKYFTVLRHPVERCISHFLNNKKLPHQPFYNRIKNMTLDEYLDSGVGIESMDYQVRLLSGCPELDTHRHPAGGRISAPPVEPRHLELAKRNIEQHFIAVAPVEAFNSLLMVLRALYGWKLWQIMFVRRNVGSESNGYGNRASSACRVPTEPISVASRRRLEETNRYDMELYDWVKDRFAEQTRAMEPEVSRDLRRFEILNAAAQRVRRITPGLVARPIGRLLSSQPQLTKRPSRMHTQA
jgi:Sulfotransferase family